MNSRRAFALLLASLMGLAMAGTAQAQNDRAARVLQAERFIQVVSAGSLARETVAASGRLLPPATRARFTPEALAALPPEALASVLRESLVHVYTADELKSLADRREKIQGKALAAKYVVYVGTTAELFDHFAGNKPRHDTEAMCRRMANVHVPNTIAVPRIQQAGVPATAD